MHTKRTMVFVAVVSMALGMGLIYYNSDGIAKEDENTYLVDRTGERWDITQAVSLGFKADGFQYGMGRDAIRPLDASSLTSDTATLPDRQRVIGVENGPDAHAYVVRKLTRHEIANTTLGDTPIAAAYWPLVDLAAVYSRQIDNRTLTLAASGWTYKSTFVLYDKETATLWYPYRKGLMGIQGHYFKRWLPKLDSEDTRWDKWVEKYPQTEVLK